MSRPPLLRPLRSLLQGRLSIAAARPCQRHVLRQPALQLRANSTIGKEPADGEETSPETSQQTESNTTTPITTIPTGNWGRSTTIAAPGELAQPDEISANPAPGVTEPLQNAVMAEARELGAGAFSADRDAGPTEAAIQAMEQEAKELEAEDRAKAAEQGVGVSRMPRSLEALYLRPLKRTPKYGLPVCNLQLRSYSVQPLEFFCDFALRAAYYLGLPASGPVPLPRKTERWTVPKSHFIFKKSQENFSRITLSRLIQIKDGHPETVQIWLAFLQKHAYYGVGMKANVWEFSTVDVAKTMDANVAKVEEAMADKWPLLGVRNTIKPSKLKELVEKDGLHNWPLMGAQGKNDPKKIEDFIAKERLNASGGR